MWFLPNYFIYGFEEKRIQSVPVLSHFSSRHNSLSTEHAETDIITLFHDLWSLIPLTLICLDIWTQEMDSFKGNSPHKPLSQSNPSEIRLVRLYAAKFDDQPRCTLENYSLTGEKEQPYIALSYTWGDANVTSPILLDGQQYPVTTNLHRFLRHAQALFSTIVKAVPPQLREKQRQSDLQILFCDIIGDPNVLRDPLDESTDEIAKLIESKLPKLDENHLPGQHGQLADAMEKIYGTTSGTSDPDGCYLDLWIDAISINQKTMLKEVTRCAV